MKIHIHLTEPASAVSLKHSDKRQASSKILR